MGTEVHPCQQGTFGTRNQTEPRMSQGVTWCMGGGAVTAMAPAPRGCSPSSSRLVKFYLTKRAFSSLT